MLIKAVGIDAAFANMGFAHVGLAVEKGKVVRIDCWYLSLLSTEAGADAKVVRKSSTELRRARELHGALINHCQGQQFAFVEVPSGSQSAQAARSLGIAVGVLAACPIPVIEVSPMEVKVAVTGDRKVKASKADVIAWAVKRWPEAPWLRMKGGKQKGRILNDNEHLADALATIVAGIATPEFQRFLTVTADYAIPDPTDLGSTPNRPARRRVQVGTL